MTEIDLSIPDFLLRANWTKAQHKRAAKLWDERITAQIKRQRELREASDRAKMIERTERKLASLNKRRAPGTVSDKIAASLERKLQRLRA
jgi:anti-sigma-K factor RskA